MQRPIVVQMKNKRDIWGQVHKIVFPFGLNGVGAKRLFKGWLATTICFIMCLIKPVAAVLGSSSYIIAIAALNHHPARRLGGMIEAVVMGLIGTGVGIAFLVFGHFTTNQIAAYSGMRNALAYLAILEIIMLTVHAFIRSYSPRLFNMVFMFFTVVHFGFLSTLSTPYGDLAKSFGYPILLGIGICFVINLSIFPEFGSTYLGTSVVKALNEMHTHTNSAVLFFTGSHSGLDQISTELLTMNNIMAQKSKLRASLANCKEILTESLFEISVSVMSPQELKKCLKVINNSIVPLNALVGACELEYSLLGESHIYRESETTATRTEATSRPTSFIESIKPTKEIDHADAKVFLEFLKGIKEPILKLSDAISQSFNIVKLSVAYAYDVPEKKVQILSSEPREIPQLTLESIDNVLQTIAEAITLYDVTVPASLEKITLTDKQALAFGDEVLMPREEFFLISSFLLNFREFSNAMVSMLNEVRIIIDIRKRREKKPLKGRSIWFSGFSSRKVFKKYLITGSAEPKETDVRSLTGVKGQEQERQQQNNEGVVYDLRPLSNYAKRGRRLRKALANFIEYPQRFKHHLRFTLKFVILLMAVSFPAFDPDMRQWYVNIRGTWVGFIAAMAMESSVGGTFKFFLARSVGVVLGSSWSYACYVAGDWGNNRYVVGVMFGIGALPFYYTFLQSSYPKAAMIGLISANMVALSTINPSVPGTILENFAKRCLAMFIGGTAALLVQITIYPIKARVELVKNITQAIQYCEYLEGCISQGIDKADIDHDPADFYQRAYDRINYYSRKAKKALANADIYLELTHREPRLKGSFHDLQKVYSEINFVLRQMIEKFQNISFLRSQYGTAVVDELNRYLFIYRRELYGSLTTTLRAVQEALSNKTPLPQYLPSSRIAHLRVVNRVREVLAHERISRANSRPASRGGSRPQSIHDGSQLELPSLNSHHEGSSLTKRKYMSWSASSTALEEIVEYVEELVELAKLIVGTNEFRHGFLSRPFLFEDWAAEAESTGVNTSDEKTTMDSRNHSRRPSRVEDDNTEDEIVPRMLRKRAFSLIGDQPPKLDQPMDSLNTPHLVLSHDTSVSSRSSYEDVPLSLRRIANRKKKKK